MKPTKIKTFKCEECKYFFPVYKLDLRKSKLIDNRKYFKTILVCGRCYNRLKDNSRMVRINVQNWMVGL